MGYRGTIRWLCSNACLSFKHEDPSWMPRTHMKEPSRGSYNTSTGRQRQEEHRLVNMASARFYKTLVSENRVESDLC